MKTFIKTVCSRYIQARSTAVYQLPLVQLTYNWSISISSHIESSLSRTAALHVCCVVTAVPMCQSQSPDTVTGKELRLEAWCCRMMKMLADGLLVALLAHAAYLIHPLCTRAHHQAGQMLQLTSWVSSESPPGRTEVNHAKGGPSKGWKGGSPWTPRAQMLVIPG